MSAPRISVVLPVLAPTPFLRAMTEFAIKCLHLHADDKAFELIVVEAENRYFDPDRDLTIQELEVKAKGAWSGPPQPTNMRIDKYLNFTPGIGGVKEANAAIAAATGEYVLCTGTDILVPPGWDSEMLRVFADHQQFCGIAALSAFEPNATIGPPRPLDLVVEGNFSPFMMWRNNQGWRYDESYERVYQDSDLILRMAEQGLRALRSCRKHVWHLGSVTNSQAGAGHSERHAASLARDERLFYERWGRSPLAQFAIMRASVQIYGREHEAYLAQIQLHHDPKAPR